MDELAEARLSQLDLEPGDVICVRVPSGTSREYIEQFRDWIVKTTGHHCIVFADDLEFSVIRPAKS